MKKLNNCVVENCIPTPSSCVIWNGGDIEYLGICNGDSLNNIVWEIVTKIEEIAGEDLSSFDIDALLDICDLKAPLEINLTTILRLLADNEICLKDYIDVLNDKINELSQAQGVNVNLKCFADFDNLGNQLKITRESLDQLVIDQLCAHEDRLDTIEGKIIQMQAEIAAIDPTATVDELSFATCIDPVIKPTSSQVVAVANELCAVETSHGTPAEVTSALSFTPAAFTTPEFMALTNWDPTPDNWAQNYGNLLVAFNYLLERVTLMEDTCCAPTCDSVKIGFSATTNEDLTGIILKFTSGAGTSIPVGWTDAGSIVEVLDINGNSSGEMAIVISNNAEIDVPLTGLVMTEPLTVTVTSKMTNGTVTCEKCTMKIVTPAPCAFCTITASGPVTIIYEITI